MNFLIFPVHGKNCLRWHQMRPGGFFPTNPDLADIFGRTDLDFENFHFLFVGFQISRFPQVSKFWIPQTELAMRGSNGIGKGPWNICGHSSFILIRKNAYLVTLALVSPTQNRRPRAQTPIFILEKQHFLVQMAQAWPGPDFGNLGTWKSWNVGSKNQKT